MQKTNKEVLQEIFPRVLFTVLPSLPLEYAKYAYDQAKNKALSVVNEEERMYVEQTIGVFYAYSLIYNKNKDANLTYDTLFQEVEGELLIEKLMSENMEKYIQQLEVA